MSLVGDLRVTLGTAQMVFELRGLELRALLGKTLDRPLWAEAHRFAKNPGPKDHQNSMTMDTRDGLRAGSGAKNP